MGNRNNTEKRQRRKIKDLQGRNDFLSEKLNLLLARLAKLEKSNDDKKGIGAEQGEDSKEHGPEDGPHSGEAGESDSK